MALFTAFVIFVFGTVIGSFLNAVIWRLRTGESVVIGRSYCPSCGHTLSPWDLIPAISYLLLRGRCRYCRKSIGAHYLAVEVSTGLLFLALAYLDLAQGPIDQQSLVRLLVHWYFAAILTIIFVYDLRYMMILPKVAVPATIIALGANLALGQSPLLLVASALGAAGFFWFQLVVSRGKWIGGGDIYLGALMGAMLGFPGTLVALFLAYVSGAVVGSLLILARRKTWKSEVPFGTFLAAATAVTLLVGERLVNWYLGFL